MKKAALLLFMALLVTPTALQACAVRIASWRLAVLADFIRTATRGIPPTEKFMPELVEYFGFNRDATMLAMLEQRAKRILSAVPSDSLISELVIMNYYALMSVEEIKEGLDTPLLAGDQTESEQLADLYWDAVLHGEPTRLFHWVWNASKGYTDFRDPDEMTPLAEQRHRLEKGIAQLAFEKSNGKAFELWNEPLPALVFSEATTPGHLYVYGHCAAPEVCDHKYVNAFLARISKKWKRLYVKPEIIVSGPNFRAEVSPLN